MATTPASGEATAASSSEKMEATRSASATMPLTNQRQSVSVDERVELPDVEVMLETMKQSARELDGILQRLCEAEGEAGEEVDDESVVVACLEPVVGLKAATNVAVDAYFKTIMKSFDGETTDRAKVFNHATLLGLRSGNDAVQPPKRDGSTFEGFATDATFLFAEPVFSFGDEPPTEETGENSTKLSWQSADVRTLPQFQQHVTRCLVRVDHSIPAEISAAIVDELVNQLASDDCVLKAVHALYPPDCVDASSRVEWRRGNCICKIHAEERAWRRQWGVQLVLTIDCVARAQALSAMDPFPQASKLGPALSCTTTSSVFVPKKAYAQSTSIDTCTSLKVSLLGEAERDDQLLTTNSTIDEVDEDEKVLPELLTVFHYGAHATLSGDSDSATSTPTTFDSTRGFQKLHINTPLPRNRIVQAACGRFHTLLLNDLGLVFSYGHAMDGCLGHGDALRQSEMLLSEPRLMEFFFDKAITVQSVAVGGDDLTGFHSAAVTREGAVYTWGVGIALGLGSVKSKSLPELVKIPVVKQAIDAEPAAPLDNLIGSIACGSGFCVAITNGGSAFTWGKWSDGRLGLGPIPIINRSSRLHGSHRQLQRFQLYPKRIGEERIQWRKVSCGDAHCVGLTRDRRVFTWGRGRQGQLGLGDGRTAMTPVLVPGLAKASWRDVAAGQDWSMAVNGHGAVWSWGACGGAVLGQFSGEDADKSATVAEILLQKQQQLHHQQQQQQQQPSKARDSLALPRFSWLRPRAIPSLSHGDVAIRCIAAGARHAAAVSMQGDLYVWGSPAQGLPSQPTLVTSTEMQGAIAEQVFCGGSQIITLASGSFLARELQRLHSALVAANEAGVNEGNQEPEPHYVRATTGADVVLLVGGGRALYAHNLVLTRRSSVLRELILNEERALDNADPRTQLNLTELLLPQLRGDIARILLEFLYTDNLTKSLDPLSYLIRDVLRAARQYKIPRLVRICRERITSASYVPLGTLLAEMEEGEADEEFGNALNQDLAFAFGDSTWADLRIVAENQSIPVHRCMLIARSEYFRALLAFGDQQQQLQSFQAHALTPLCEIAVEESYVGMLRVLRFIYNDELTTLDGTPVKEGEEISGEDEEEDVTERLLEDLIAADKYGLVRMKRLCEHHIEVTPINCVDVLVVADLVHAQHLKQLALTFIQTHLHLLTTASSSATGSVLQRLAVEFPHLLTELHDYTQQLTQQQMLLRDWHKQLETQWQQHHEAQAKQAQAKQAETQFPWVPLVMALVFATLYLTMMNAYESDYPIVPAINIVVLGGLISLAFLGRL